MQIDTKRVLRRIELRLTEIDMEKGEFYAKSGISSGSYSQWNTEAHQPSLKKLRAAASVLGVSLEYLLYGGGEEKESAPDPKTEGAKWDNDEDFKEAVALLKKMDKETLRVFVKAARGAVGEQQR
jgi:transcriptional regulator with XRE-family HTH domain|nr:MAG TPA: ESX-1 secretion-associated regulator [Caudoviricetes sp.]